MQKQILAELKELRSAMTQLAGTSTLPAHEQLSAATLNKVAQEFKKLILMREQWIDESELYSYFKDSRYGVGKFIREEFAFSNYYMQGRSYYYNKADILALAKELKQRNVKLSRYVELKEDLENFKKKIASAAQNKKAAKKRKPYLLPDDLQDINTSQHPLPSVEIAKEDIKKLETEFFENKLGDYIDIYKGSHGMVNFGYSLKRYINDELRKRCIKWCENFNYANQALELLTKKRTNFIPVKEEEMIQL